MPGHAHNRVAVLDVIQGSAKRLRPGLVNFLTAVAYHFYLALPAGFTKPGWSLLADPCTGNGLMDFHNIHLSHTANTKEEELSNNSSEKRQPTECIRPSSLVFVVERGLIFPRKLRPQILTTFALIISLMRCCRSDARSERDMSEWEKYSNHCWTICILFYYYHYCRVQLLSQVVDVYPEKASINCGLPCSPICISVEHGLVKIGQMPAKISTNDI